MTTPKQWSVPMQLTFSTHVTVEADTKEEARSKAERGDWEDNGMDGAELVDWDVRGKPKEDA